MGIDFVTDLTPILAVLLAFAGTVSQIVGSRLTERGTPPDDPWAAERTELSQEPIIRSQAKRWRDRLWGTALGLTGTMLLLDSVMVSLFTISRLKLVAGVLSICPLFVIAWVVWTSHRQAQSSIAQENETIDYLHKIGKG